MKNKSIPCEVRRRAWILIALASLWAAPVQAHLNPDRIAFQGIATDDLGRPLEGAVDLHFAIYESAEGGTPLWQETHPGVMLSDGLFQVHLGEFESFETLVFDTLYYLGVRVDDDSEMSPRQPIVSVPYALRAQEANTLQGHGPDDLDQSPHTVDLSNPHRVTAVQVGAIGRGELLAHTEDDANPHLVTAAQIGATDIRDFKDHTLDPEAHHLRYADLEAVEAMGASDASNPLNHDRYTDAEAITAVGPHVSSVDGLSGGLVVGSLRSTRNLESGDAVIFGDGTRQTTAATTVANRLRVSPKGKGGDFDRIQAAIDSIEPTAESPWRIDIDPGTYREVLTLKSWIHLAGAGLRGTIIVLSADVENGVTASGIAGVRISDLSIIDPLGSPDASYGIEMQASEVTLENVRIEGFRKHRIHAQEGSSLRVDRSEIDGGMESDAPGILLLESSAVVTHSDFDHNVDCGVRVDSGGRLDASNNRFAWSPDGICVEGATAHARILDNRFDETGIKSTGGAQIVGNEIGDRVWVEGGEVELIGNRIFAGLEIHGGRARISSNRVEADVVVDDGEHELVGNRIEGRVSVDVGQVRLLGNHIGTLEVAAAAGPLQVVGNEIAGGATVAAPDALVFGNYAPNSTTGDRLVSYESLSIGSEIGSVTLQTASGAAAIELDEQGDITIRTDGALSLEGESVRIESSSSFDVQAGSTVKIEGSAGAELSTGAVLDLKGSMININ